MEESSIGWIALSLQRRCYSNDSIPVPHFEQANVCANATGIILRYHHLCSPHRSTGINPGAFTRYFGAALAQQCPFGGR